MGCDVLMTYYAGATRSLVYPFLFILYTFGYNSNLFKYDFIYNSNS